MIQKIVVINSKGGCGKTTLSTNLASYYANHGYPTSLFDYDPQDSATRWLRQRPAELAGIHGVAAAHPPKGGVTRSFQMRVPPDTKRLVLDTPASMKRMELIEILRDATAIIVPVLPSTIDSRVTADFIKDLSSEMHVQSLTAQVAMVANRVRRNTRAFQELMSSLEDMAMLPVSCLRDSQNYVQAAADGVGIHEMKTKLTRVDRDQWQPLIDWLESIHPDTGTDSPYTEKQRISA